MQIGLFDAGTPAAQYAGPFVAYCDGACKGNPGPGGWGVRMEDAQGKMLDERYGGEANTTNNKMELTAAIEALKQVPEKAKVDLYTDSQYVEKGLSNWLAGWKRKQWKTASGDPVKNVELWKALDALYQKRQVTLHWVRGHNGHPGNERADTLANLGVAQVS